MAEVRVRNTDATEIYAVTGATGDGAAPTLELRARPFEAVVRMAELARTELGKARVELGVRCRHHNHSRPGVFEECPLECREPRWIEVLHYLDDGGAIEAFQPAIAVSKRAEQEPDARGLGARK